MNLKTLMLTAGISLAAVSAVQAQTPSWGYPGYPGSQTPPATPASARPAPPGSQATAPTESGYGYPGQPGPAITEVPLVRNRYRTFTLLGTLNGTTIVPLTLDTGASDVTIPENIATELMRDGSLTPADYVGVAVSTLADGSKRHDTLYTLRSITVGHRTVTDVECLVGEEGSSLLLGQSFLRKFASWSLDNVRGVLVLKWLPKNSTPLLWHPVA